MKIIIRLCSIIILLSLFCSCGKTYSEDSDEQGFARNYVRILSYATELDRTMLFFDNPSGQSRYLRYADTENGTAGPLCGKAECTHSDSSCNAWVDWSFTAYAYKDRIYWIQTSTAEKCQYLMCMDRTGENHKQIRQLTNDWNDIDFPSGDIHMQIHHGIAFVAGDSSTITDGEYKDHCVIRGFDLDSNKEYTVLNSEISPNASWVRMHCYGDYVYYVYTRRPDPVILLDTESEFREEGNKEQEDPVLLQDTNKMYQIFCRYNINTEETEVLYETDQAEYSVNGIIPEKDALYFITGQGNDDGLTVPLFRMDYKSGQIETCYDIDINGAPSTTYIMDGKMVVYLRPDKGVFRYIVTDFTGNILMDSNFLWEPIDKCMILFSGGDDRNLYTSFVNLEKWTSYFVSVSLKEKSMKILWQEEHPNSN